MPLPLVFFTHTVMIQTRAPVLSVTWKGPCSQQCSQTCKFPKVCKKSVLQKSEIKQMEMMILQMFLYFHLIFEEYVNASLHLNKTLGLSDSYWHLSTSLNGILKSRQSGDCGLNVKLMKENAVLIEFLRNKLMPHLSSTKNSMRSLRRSKMQIRVIFTT